MNVFSKLEKLGTREKALLILGLVILLAALGDRLVVQYVMDRLQAMHASIEIEEERLAYNRQVVESRDQVERVYEQVRGNLAEAETAASDLDVMKGQLDDLAIRSNLEVVEVRHRDPRQLPYTREYIVDIAFQGTMENLLKFLHAMQQSQIPGMLSVDQLTVGVGREEDTIKGAMTITKVAVDQAS